MGYPPKIMIKKKTTPIGLVAALLFAIGACNSDIGEKERLFQQLSKVRAAYAPDKRTALFDIAVTENTKRYVLRGESNLPVAVAALKERLESENIGFTDSIRLLPSPDLEGYTQAIINISVANLRSNPKHSAELSTQGTLGTPVIVLKKEGGWYYIQTPDKYLAWVDDGGIKLMDSLQLEKWKTTDKIIYTKTYGHAYESIETQQPVSDLVAGNVLELLQDADDFYMVRYPDGREAHIWKDEAEKYEEWIENLNPSSDNLVATSKTLMGVPYLWGGTSTKGMDCSGFTKTIYFLNGMVIPRDASQQVHTGKPIDSLKNFENLQKGDLLFFGRKATDSTAERVVHVGMWIGNNEFIHASEMVRISSMDKDAENFDEWNLNRYLRTKRILRERDEGLISLSESPIFKD